MKNNSEIVNNTMCKSCLREHKEMTGHEPIDCAFKYFENEYCEEAQTLADYITNLQSQLDHQKAMWNKLKEWIKETAEEECKDCFYFQQYFRFDEILEKIQELEKGEKDVKD